MSKRRNKSNLIYIILAVIAVLIIALIAGIVLSRGRNKDEGAVTSAVNSEDGGSQDQASASAGAEDSDTETVEVNRLDSLVSGMSLKEKVCQLIIVHPTVLTGIETVIAAGESTEKALRDYPVAGIMYDASNFETEEQTIEMLSMVQGYTKIPLLLSVDEEGGNISKMLSTLGVGKVDAMFKYKDDGPEKAKENAKEIADALKHYGINLDMAPVADVYSNPENTVIGTRAYSDNFEEAAELIAAAVDGFHSGGIACTLKHFPGRGETSEDSDTGVIRASKNLSQLRKEEFLPFKAGIDAGAELVMIGHFTVPEFGEDPVVFSKRMINDILRDELGFQGVVTTDALNMGGLTSKYTRGEIAVKAINAGVDVLLMPEDLAETVKAVMDAVSNGEIEESRINESVKRVLTLKIKMGLME